MEMGETQFSLIVITKMYKNRDVKTVFRKFFHLLNITPPDLYLLRAMPASNMAHEHTGVFGIDVLLRLFVLETTST